MKKNITSVFASCLISIGINSSVLAQAFTENFDNITTLAGSGWSTFNNSTPVGSITNWFQGTSVAGGGPFDAFNGAANAYIAANYNFTSGANTINGWLITPNRTFKNGDILTFYTRKATGLDYPDRLEVRLSTNGASTNVGTGAAVGDFTTLLMSVNPSLVTGVYPTTWTQYTITISGLSAPTSGRIAFRYYVTNGGPTGTNSDYIGIDNVVYTPYVCPTLTMTPAGALSGATAGTPYSTTLSQTGALGAPTFTVTAGALPPGLTLSTGGTISGTPTATGTFNFTVTVNDNSGCSTSSSYTIISVCSANPTSLNGLPTLCSNDASYALVQGLPVGGTYSGTGVTGGSFDPSLGTQVIVYDYTDPYGCSFFTSNTITVNAAPIVTLSAFSDLCSNDAPIVLTEGTPAGGSYMGTGVSAGTFDPSVGTQSIMYMYTDGNACSNMASGTLNVNIAPVVSHSSISDICENAGVSVITGGAPAGGIYSGTGISGSDFDPSVGSQTIDYAYTDGNGCSNSTSVVINVIPSVSADFTPIADMCSNDGPVLLTTGSPNGGVYSGTGVATDVFDPSVGTQTISYTIGTGTACESTATIIATVNTAPTVSFVATPSVVCVYHSSYALVGGLPAGGSYSGIAVTGGNFDPSIAGIGAVNVDYSFTDGNGCSSTASSTITVDDCASVNELSAMSCVLYPNPASSSFTITVSATIVQFDVDLYDITGKKIEIGIQKNGDNALFVDLKSAKSGIYFLKGIINGQLINVPVNVQ